MQHLWLSLKGKGKHSGFCRAALALCVSVYVMCVCVFSVHACVHPKINKHRQRTVDCSSTDCRGRSICIELWPCIGLLHRGLMGVHGRVTFLHSGVAAGIFSPLSTSTFLFA